MLAGDPTTTLAHLTVCDEFDEYWENKRAPAAIMAVAARRQKQHKTWLAGHARPVLWSMGRIRIFRMCRQDSISTSEGRIQGSGGMSVLCESDGTPLYQRG
jgi:hypothetical protein